MAKRRNINFLFAAMLMLGAVALYLHLTGGPGTLSTGERSFAIRDTASVRRIEISTAGGSTVLSRESGSWTVDRKYPADIRMVRALLTVMKRLDIPAPASRSIREKLLPVIRKEGRRVRIGYGRRQRLFYVYYDSVHTGTTYILRENSERPFRAKIHGYSGRDLTVFFRTDPGYWRDHNVFSASPFDILEVSVHYPGEPERSFVISVPENGKYTLKSPGNRVSVDSVNLQNLTAYLTYFRSVPFESTVTDLSSREKDSILASVPMHRVRLELKNGRSKFVETYRKYFPSTGEPDYNLMYGKIPGTNEILLLSYFKWDAVTRDIGYFLVR